MNKLRQNMVYNVVYQLLLLLVPFVTTPYVSRVLGTDGVGTYSVTTVIAKYFYLFALLGMATYGNRSIAKARDNRENLSVTFWNLYYFQVILSLLALAVYLGYAFRFGVQKYDVVTFCQIPYVLTALFEVNWFFAGMEQFKLTVTRNGIVKIATMVAIFCFVKDAGDVWVYALINALSLLLGQLCTWPFVLKQVSFAKPQRTLILGHFKPNLVLFVSVLAVSAYTMLDKIMIEWFSTRAEVGIYENAEKIMTMVNGVIGSMGAVMLPRISNLVENRKDREINAYFQKSMKYIMALAIALAFGMAGISQEFSIIFFGKAFTAAGPVCMILSICVLSYSWENVLRTQYLLPHEKDRIFVQGTVFAAILNVVVNLLLIGPLGARGAAIGTVAAQTFAALYQTWKVRKDLPFLSYLKALVPFALIGALMFGYCRLIGVLLGAHIVTVLIQILGGAVIFCLLAGVLLYRQNDELLTRALKKVRK